jgi:multidrug efflux pump subunit AcrA (membrane-fusion protein)
VILDKTAVQNLRIKTEMVEERDFESTVFAIGRIEEIDNLQSIVSSRAPGKVIELNVAEGDYVEKGQVVARLEARVYGNPPPKLDLKALQSGIVTDVHVHLGEPVEPEEDLFILSNREKVWAVAKIPEVEAGEVKVGSRARIRIPAMGEREFEASLARFGIDADRESGSVIGIFELENKAREMHPGMRVEFSIITSARDFVMSVPRESIQGDPTKRVVFVKDFELPNAFVRAPVVLGESNDKYVEVINGLFPGDEVVTTGSYSLGFAGSGSGMSLKDALDAAHGHEHNEDGSEMTPAQQAAQAKEKAIARGESFDGGSSKFTLPLLIWAGLATVLFLVTAQMLMVANRKLKNA